MNQITNMTPPQLKLVKHTIAKDCNEGEFDLFIAFCQTKGLDPFTKQAIPLVFSKDDEKKRRMSIVVTRDGLRVIASRCGDYRPASEPPSIVFDEALISPTNPKGIVSATVKLWKQDKNGEWFAVIGEAYWDEFVAISKEWAWNEQKGKRLPTGKEAADGNWNKMPIVMITKCAEAQALRAGWPEQFVGVYVEEEMERTQSDVMASEVVAKEEQEDRQRKIGGANSLTTWWGDNFALENVQLGEFADRVLAHINETDGPRIKRWWEMNNDTLKRFWTIAPADAFELKKALEKAAARPADNEQKTEAA